MTEKDKKLISEARKVPCSEWWKVDDMREKADSDEAREALHVIASSKYHKDEFFAGTL